MIDPARVDVVLERIRKGSTCKRAPTFQDFIAAQEVVRALLEINHNLEALTAAVNRVAACAEVAIARGADR